MDSTYIDRENKNTRIFEKANDDMTNEGRRKKVVTFIEAYTKVVTFIEVVHLIVLRWTMHCDNFISALQREVVGLSAGPTRQSMLTGRSATQNKTKTTFSFARHHVCTPTMECGIFGRIS